MRQNYKMLGLFLILAVYLIFPANAQIQIQPAGQGPTGQTALNGTVSTSSTLVNLTASSNYITLVNTSANTLYFSAVSPATTSSFPILTNSAYTYEGVPLSSFYLIGSSSGTTYGVIAH